MKIPLHLRSLPNDASLYVTVLSEPRMTREDLRLRGVRLQRKEFSSQCPPMYSSHQLLWRPSKLWIHLAGLWLGQRKTFSVLARVQPGGSTVLKVQKDDTIQFCIMRSDPPTVVRSLTVSADLTWYAHILDRVVPHSNTVIQSLPAKANSESFLLHILSTVQLARVCPGNPEEQFERLLKRNGGKACGRSGDICAYVDDKEEIVVDEKSYAKTVRRSGCRLICSRNSSSLQRCPSCSKYRLQLFVERSREAKKTVNWTNHNSNVPYKCLTPSEKDEHMTNLEKVKRAEKQKNTRLREQLQKEIGDKGVALVEDSDDITALLSDVFPLVDKTFSKGSLQRIFWEQQAKYNFLKNS